MKKKIRVLLNRIKWNNERFFYKVDKKKALDYIPTGKKILLIPHSDDEWIGCSQIIKNDNDVLIVNMNMSGNDTIDVHKKRYNEMFLTANNYNIAIKTLLNDKINSLSNIILEEKPKYVCLPYYIDWHEEHIEVMNILKKAIEKSKYSLDIIMYQVSLPMYGKDITNYIKLTKKEWRFKWYFFKDNYKTQENFPYFRFATNERINGKYFGCFAAEVFCIMPGDKWISQLNRKLLSKKQREEVLDKLHSIKETRNYLKGLH